MTRTLQPELLDMLPADNPEAANSRTDLRRINTLMGHRRILLRMLQTVSLTNVQRIVELGAGDGTLALSLATALNARWPQVELTLVDQQRLVTTESVDKFYRLGWLPSVVQADVFAWFAEETRPMDIIFTNLFFHHFNETSLRRLLCEATTHCSCFIALETRRQVVARLGCELLWMIGCNRVTRYDARASVRAGFRKQELSSLWLNFGNWRLRAEPAGMFSHLFVAMRNSP